MIDNKGRFMKGHVTWSKGTKGILKPNSSSFKKGNHYSSRTEFKKRQIPWIAGLEIR